MAAEIKVGVGADVKPLKDGLKDGEKAIKAFDSTVEKAAVKSEKAIEGLSKTAVKANKAIGVSFQGTSRVVQDFAFGPGAIANNLAGLGDDWKQLATTAKDSNQSIAKTLLASLSGPGGINLALGASTLAFSVASFGLQAWTRLFPKATDEVLAGTQALKEYMASLDAVTRTQLTGAQDAQDEIASLRVLFAAYQNANLPLKERKEAYKQLQDKYPAYFDNLQFEESATGKTKDAYNKLTSAILSTARARAAEALIAKNSSTQLENEQRILSIEEARIPLIKQAAEVQKKLSALQADRSGSEANAAIQERTARTLIELQNKIAESIKASNDLKLQNNRLDQENLRLEQQAVKNVVNEVKEVEKLDALIKQMNPLSSVLSLGSKPLKPKADLKTPGLDLSGFQNAFAALKPQLDAGLQMINDWNAQIVQILQFGAVNAFQSLGDAIGNAIGTGQNVFEAAGASLLASIGDVLVQMGKLTIAAGVASTALFASLSNPLNPLSGPAAIAAGIALVAVGSAVKGFSGSIGKGGKGGGGGQSFTPSVPSGFEASAPTGSRAIPRDESFTLNTVLRGQDLALSVQRTNALNGRTG